MFEWLNGEGAALKHHIPGSTNYLTDLKERNAAARARENALKDPSNASEAEEETAPAGGNRPFPLNPTFVSEPILSEELRNEIYKRVVEQKKSVRSVSVEFGVDMRRVAAVVRLVELEKRWRKQVCSCPCSFSFHVVFGCNDEQNRLVLKTHAFIPSMRMFTEKNYNSLKQPTVAIIYFVKTL